jgi:hypothetical protein
LAVAGDAALIEVQTLAEPLFKSNQVDAGRDLEPYAID